MEEFSKPALQALLVKKHENLLTQYTDEKDNLEKNRSRIEELKKRIGVLREKEDQLKHWVAEREGDDSFADQLAQNREELAKVKAELKSTPRVRDWSRRLSWLTRRIQSHEQALDYWKKQHQQKEASTA